MSNLVSGDGCAWHLYHGADHIFDFNFLFLHGFVSHATHDGQLIGQFGAKTHQRNHDFRVNLDGVFALHHFGCGFENSLRLHFGDFRIQDTQTTATATQHRVFFVQSFYAVDHKFQR